MDGQGSGVCVECVCLPAWRKMTQLTGWGREDERLAATKMNLIVIDLIVRVNYFWPFQLDNPLEMGSFNRVTMCQFRFKLMIMVGWTRATQNIHLDIFVKVENLQTPFRGCPTPPL